MRLIDADALIEKIKNFSGYFSDNISTDNLMTKIEVECLVDDEDTVDAVPVVRCKDCNWYHISGVSAGRCKMDGFQWPEDGFCSMGEIRVNMEV